MTEDKVQQIQLGHPRVFRIGRKNFAFGLFWASVEEAKDLTREAKSFARETQVQADLYVLRSSVDVAQYGVGRKSDGLVAGSIAAAACAAELVKGSWLGVFPVANGYWYVAVQRDHVMPRGDMFYEDEIEVRERFEVDRRRLAWDRVIAPRAWSDQVEDVPLEQLLEGARAPKLTEVNPLGRQLKIVLGGALAAAVVMTGAWWYKSLQVVEELEPITPIVQPLPPPAPPKADWYDAPGAGQVLTACYAALEAAPMVAPGYTLSGISCDAARWTVSFKRDTGTASWFAAAMKARGPNGAVVAISGDGQSADLSALLPRRPGRGREGLHRQNEVSQRLIEAAQISGDTFTLGSPRLPPPPQPGTEPQAVPPPPTFAPMAIEVRTLAPKNWTRLLGAIPGLVINRVTMNPSDTYWTIQGDVYVRL